MAATAVLTCFKYLVGKGIRSFRCRLGDNNSNSVELIRYNLVYVQDIQVPLVIIFIRGFLPLKRRVFFAIPALILRNYITIDSYLRISLVVSISMFCYLIFVLIIYFNKKQKKVLLEKFGIKYAF